MNSENNNNSNNNSPGLKKGGISNPFFNNNETLIKPTIENKNDSVSSASNPSIIQIVIRDNLENESPSEINLNAIEYHTGSEQRLDKFLGTIAKVGSRSKAEYLIKNNFVTVNNKQANKTSLILKNADLIQVTIPPAEPVNLQPLNINLEILFEDKDIAVVNKPAGLVVHPAAGHAQDTLVNVLIAQIDDLSMGYGEERPGIVHRIDKDTSGILVIAKNDMAQENLVQQFKSRQVHRIYYALCLGVPLQAKGRITSYLSRHPTDRKKFSSVLGPDKKIIRNEIPNFEKGKWAATNYELIDQTGSGISYLKLKLETGRTHQIRVHLSEIGIPIAADPIYTQSNKLISIKSVNDRKIIQETPRLALHAAELGFNHPKTLQPLHFSVDWPQDIQPVLNKLGLKTK